MRIVTASTEEQEKHIDELIGKIYEDIFPLYFSKEKIDELKELSVLLPEQSQHNYNGTIDEAFQIMSSLQTLVALLEKPDCKHYEKYREMYERNIKILKQYGYSFPLSYHHFPEKPSDNRFGKAANDWMI
ncbi:DUF5365 family protein [Metabacillus sp. RGM 3146]|uniref:DUF5365 family protein n=1 Tax=Metabacillus sp. RGM 3146 TaxID=3401092 RepID=UPI003B9BF571